MGVMDDKVVIVTGASRGIGQGQAIAFAEAGAKVVACARSIDKVEETCAAIRAKGGTAVAVACDVMKLDDIEAVVQRAVVEFGGIDVLINNAQTIEYLFINDSADQTMQDVLDSGPLASYRFMKAAHPYLKARRGVVVNTGSTARYLPSTARYALYNAAKAGIEALTRAAADEWREDGISVFMINPSAESTMSLNWKKREPEKYAAATAAMPGGRLGDPLEDVGRPLVRLVAFAERYSGKTLNIDGAGVADTIETITKAPFPLP